VPAWTTSKISFTAVITCERIRAANATTASTTTTTLRQPPLRRRLHCLGTTIRRPQPPILGHHAVRGFPHSATVSVSIVLAILYGERLYSCSRSMFLVPESSLSGGFHRASSSFEARYCPASSNQAQHQCATDSDEQDNNYEEEHFKNELNRDDASYGGFHEYTNTLSASAMASQDPHEQHRLRHDLGVFAVKRLDHNVFLPPSHRFTGSECSPREEFLVQAFGPSSFKLQSASSTSSKDELEDCFSDDSSSNNREHSSPCQPPVSADADTELKMSFNELEADLRGAMQQTLHYQQHSTRLAELTGLSLQPFASSGSSLGLGRSANYPRSNQEVHRAPVFGQPQSAQPHLIPNQKETGFYPREQQQPSPSRSQTPQHKSSSAVQTPTKWLRDEDERLRVAVARFGGKNWRMIAETLGNGRTDVQCLHRWNKVLKPGLIKGPWTPEEDRVLTGLINRYGVGKIRWCDLALHLPGRIGKQCRERWCNHLDSRIRKGQWTPEEDDMVFRWQQKLGNKWSEIAKLLPGRTENAVKNRFNSAARRKWQMNQGNQAPSAPQTPAPTQNQSQVSPHMQLPQQSPREGHTYNINTMAYSSNEVGRVAPLPGPASLVAAMDDHPKMSPPPRRQSYSQHFPPAGQPTPGASLSSDMNGPHAAFRPALPTIGEQVFQQDHDKHPEARKSDATLFPPPTFVPPPLNALFALPPGNGAAVAGRSFNHPPAGAEMTGFSFTTNLPTLLQHDEPTLGAATTAPASSSDANTDNKDGDLPLLHMKEEKIKREDLAPTEPNAAPDASVPMDDENMSSFLDSVALELDDILE
jgi:hypothetical protein